MRRSLAVLAIAATVAGLVALGRAVWSGGGHREVVPPEGPPDSLETTSPTSGLPANVEPVVERVTNPPPVAPGTEEHRSRIRGRVIDAEGAPIAGAELLLKAPRQEDVHATSGADGAFAMSLSLERSRRLEMEVSAEGYVTGQWFHRVLPTEDWNLGECRLYRGGDVLVSVVGPDGTLLRTGVTITSQVGASDPGRHPFFQGSGEPRPDGRYFLSSLPAGPAEVSANNDGESSTPIEVLAGEVVEVVLQGTSRIEIVVDVKGMGGVSEPAPEAFRLIGPGFDVGATRSLQGLGFEDVPAGLHRIEVHDPRFLPWSQDGVQAGAFVHAQLEGSASLRLRVEDGSGQGAESPHRFRTTYVDHADSTFPLPPMWSDLLVEEGLARVVPGDLRIQARSADGDLGEVDVLGLAPGETRDVVVPVVRTGSLEGTVRRTDGSPAAGAAVYLLPWSPDRESQSFEALSRSLREEKADARGRFAFSRVPPGRYECCATLGECIGDPLSDVTLKPETPGEIELTVPTGSFLAGRIEGLDRPRSVRLALALDPAARTSVAASLGVWKQLLPVKLDAGAGVESDGRFRVGPVEPGGPYTLCASHRSGPGTVESSISGRGVYELGTYTLAEGENAAGTLDGAWLRMGTLLVQVEVSSDVPTSEGGPKLTVMGRDGYRKYRVADGRELSCTLPPGEFFGWIEEEDWVVTAFELVTVRPGESTRVRTRVELAEGSLRILDETTGEPLANEPIALRFHIPGERQSDGLTLVPGDRVRTTDSEGFLTLRFGLARYEVRFGERFELPGLPLPAPDVIEWTSSGPVPSEVRLGGR